MRSFSNSATSRKPCSASSMSVRPGEPGLLAGSPFAITAPRSLHDPRHHAGADGAAAFADGEAGLFREGHGLVEFDRELRAVARQHHLGAVSELDPAGDIG